MGTPSNIHGTAISYHCAKFGAFVNSVTILTLADLTIKSPARFDLSITTEQPGNFSDMLKELKWGTLETRRKTNNKLVPNSETKKT